ncbi:THUMP-like domain-containing protein [Maribacter sp. 4G9]|uniref:THUMP-like domain-containing protein n=1 Tax=Maribacter sp. 4G9 TaxID=1889777 RepID=UPI000C153A3B|nr:SAM-dependent methyltransferase [Maribacter sp. 4G9]PIB38786.1 SAM-dependent methyltransferase [Maribacter sp. 4G9]
MNLHLLYPEVQEFIDHNLNTDVHSVLLGKNVFPGIENRELVEQLESKKKSQKKLPTWFGTENIYYANKLNISQTSSEATARYKADLVSGDTLTDLTGGFGVDSYYFSKKIKLVFHIEKNKELSDIAEHNFRKLGSTNISCFAKDGIEYLETLQDTTDWLFLDPSRRDSNNKKVYFLQDCEPDVTRWMQHFFSKSNNILIKTGPLLDISMGLQQLQNVYKVHILSVENEVKEVLWELKKDHREEPLIKAVNLNGDTKESFEFLAKEERTTLPEYSEPLSFLYEPNTAIMKSGGFNLVGKRYGLKKLQEHSHLYTSNVLVPFPGRTFEISNVFPYNKKSIKGLGFQKANVTTRNFPESVAQIRKKTKLKDGGEHFLFFTKNYHNDLIMISACQTGKKKG